MNDCTPQKNVFQATSDSLQQRRIIISAVAAVSDVPAMMQRTRISEDWRRRGKKEEIRLRHRRKRLGKPHSASKRAGGSTAMLPASTRISPLSAKGLTTTE